MNPSGLLTPTETRALSKSAENIQKPPGLSDPASEELCSLLDRLIAEGREIYKNDRFSFNNSQFTLISNRDEDPFLELVSEKESSKLEPESESEP